MHYPQLDHVFFLFRGLLLTALVVLTVAGVILAPELGAPLLILLIADLIGMACGEIAHFIRRQQVIKTLLMWIAIILTFPLNLTSALLVIAVTGLLSLVELAAFVTTPADYRLLWRNFGWRQIAASVAGVGMLVMAFEAVGSEPGAGSLLLNLSTEFFGAYIIFLLIGGGLFRSGEISTRDSEKTRRIASSVLAVSLICFGLSVWSIGFNTLQNDLLLNLGTEFLGALWIYLLLENGMRGYWNVFRLAYVGHARIQYFRDRLILTAPMLIFLSGVTALVLSMIGMRVSLTEWIAAVAPNFRVALIGAALLAWLILGAKSKISTWRALLAGVMALAVLAALVVHDLAGGADWINGLFLNYGAELFALALTFALLDARTDMLFKSGKSALESAADRLSIRVNAQQIRETARRLDEQGNSSAARSEYEKARQIYLKTDDLHGIADTLVNIGTTFATENRFQEAIPYFDDAIAYYRRAFPNYPDHPNARAARSNAELARKLAAEYASGRTLPPSRSQSITDRERHSYLNFFRLIVVILIHAVWGVIAALPLLWWWRDTPMTTPGLPQFISAAVAAVILHGVVYLVMLQLPMVSGSYRYDPIHPQAPPLIGELKLSYGALSMVGVIILGLFVSPVVAAVSAVLAGYCGYRVTQLVDPYGRADTPAWLYATWLSFLIGISALLIGGFELGTAFLLSVVVIFAANFIGTMVVAVLTSLANNTKVIVFMPLGIGIAALMLVWLVVFNQIIG